MVHDPLGLLGRQFSIRARRGNRQAHQPEDFIRHPGGIGGIHPGGRFPRQRRRKGWSLCAGRLDRRWRGAAVDAVLDSIRPQTTPAAVSNVLAFRNELRPPVKNRAAPCWRFFRLNRAS